MEYIGKGIASLGVCAFGAFVCQLVPNLSFFIVLFIILGIVVIWVVD